MLDLYNSLGSAQPVANKCAGSAIVPANYMSGGAPPAPLAGPTGTSEKKFPTALVVGGLVVGGVLLYYATQVGGALAANPRCRLEVKQHPDGSWGVAQNGRMFPRKFERKSDAVAWRGGMGNECVPGYAANPPPGVSPRKPYFRRPVVALRMRRKGQRVRFFDIRGQQAWTETPNVAPALAYADYMKWREVRGPVSNPRESIRRIVSKAGWSYGLAQEQLKSDGVARMINRLLYVLTDDSGDTVPSDPREPVVVGVYALDDAAGEWVQVGDQTFDDLRSALQGWQGVEVDIEEVQRVSEGDFNPGYANNDSYSPFPAELLPGGRAAGMRPSDFDPEQLARGTEHELEHTDDWRLAQEIASDHLVEDEKYYQKLDAMERGSFRDNPLEYDDSRDAWCDTRTGRCGPNAPFKDNPKLQWQRTSGSDSWSNSWARTTRRKAVEPTAPTGSCSEPRVSGSCSSTT
jgi:hypothetical protein